MPQRPLELGVPGEHVGHVPPAVRQPRLDRLALAGVGPVELHPCPRAAHGRPQRDPRGTVDALRVAVEVHVLHAYVLAEEEADEIEGVGPVVRETAAPAAVGVQIPAVTARVLLDRLLVADGE